MTTARDIMTPQVEFAHTDDTIQEAAARMAAQDVGALPVCSPERRLEGVLTDRDIALRVVAAGLDPVATTVGEIRQQGEVVTIGADDSVQDALRTMKQHAVRRLPVIDGHEVVGMISQADIATNLSDDMTGDLVEAISKAP